MRENLFRGKSNCSPEWVEGDLIHLPRGVAILTKKGYDYVKPETVGQYTGLTDKNGKKIFEGDIVEHHVQGNILVCRGVINWDERNAQWSHLIKYSNPGLALFTPAAWEVIGNIHDIPELLEDQHE